MSLCNAYVNIIRDLYGIILTPIKYGSTYGSIYASNFPQPTCCHKCYVVYSLYCTLSIQRSQTQKLQTKANREENTTHTLYITCV